MYNTDLPTRAELPSAQKLFRSTLSALVVAGVLLVTIVLPSEYAIDPTGLGSALGLTRMGEIKTQLAAEAQQEPVTSQSSTTVMTESVPVAQVAVDSVTPAPVTEPVAAVPQSIADRVPADADPAVGTDQMTITLQPNEATEVKMEMRKGARVEYRWATQSGVLNYDTHGDSKDIDYHGYGKGKASKGDSGVLEAAFDGKHGWFWRNRDGAPVTVILDTKGEYLSIKRML